MKVPQDDRFRRQRQRFALRFTCEHCALFSPQQESCAHGFPVTEHRTRYYDNHDAPIVFCKDFDLV